MRKIGSNRNNGREVDFPKKDGKLVLTSRLHSSFNVTSCKDYESAALPTELGWRVRAGIDEQHGNVNCTALCGPAVGAISLVRLE
jgi:hypothetical protein